MQQFADSCRKTYLDEITTDDLKEFVSYLKATGAGDRTISNRLVEVGTFLRAHGVKDVSLRHLCTEKKVKAYRADEMQRLFAAATPEEWIMFQFFLCTGGREQEVQHAEWSDVDFTDGIFTVRAKEDWQPKDKAEREVPIPDFLVKALEKRMLRSTSKLIFPTKDGKVHGHMLRVLKELAKRAGLQGEFILRKFRKSFATLQHRAGTDAQTLQKRLGHSDLSTTLMYLEGEDARSDKSREQVNNTFGCFAEEVSQVH